jgi:REP element-mobilizing transposase RayT
MILAHHCILGFYGFWLPNDPRGSGSDYIASWELFRYGKATKVHSARSVAHRRHNHALRVAAKSALNHRPIKLTGRQARAVARGFALAAQESDYRVHGLAILPDHIHLVVSWHVRDIRLIVGHMRSKATVQLRTLGEPPFSYEPPAIPSEPPTTPSSRGARTALQPVWGEHAWNVPLDTLEGIDRAITYTESNPAKEGLRRQRWSFVVPFDLAHITRGRSLTGRDRVPLYQKRALGGAALRSKQDRIQREQELEQSLRSKPDPEPPG